MFTDTVSHRLSNGVEARSDGLHMHIDIVCIVELWFRAKADLVLTAQGNSMYCWPWKEAAKYLCYEEGKPWLMRSDTEYGRGGSALICGTKPKKEQPPTRRLLNRIAAILCDDEEGFKILHWCLTTLGGRDE